jgi:hypothetical protein
MKRTALLRGVGGINDWQSPRDAKFARWCAERPFTLLWPAPTSARHAGVPQAFDRGLVRDHYALIRTGRCWRRCPRRQRRCTWRAASERKPGVRYVYTGHIYDPEGQSTYCHGCKALLIGRDCYELTAWSVTAEGRCQRCGTPCAGVFEETHGRWGQRRQRVTVRPLTAHAAPR